MARNDFGTPCTTAQECARHPAGTHMWHHEDAGISYNLWRAVNERGLRVSVVHMPEKGWIWPWFHQKIAAPAMSARAIMMHKVRGRPTRAPRAPTIGTCTCTCLWVDRAHAHDTCAWVDRAHAHAHGWTGHMHMHMGGQGACTCTWVDRAHAHAYGWTGHTQPPPAPGQVTPETLPTVLRSWRVAEPAPSSLAVDCSQSCTSWGWKWARRPCEADPVLPPSAGLWRGFVPPWNGSLCPLDPTAIGWKCCFLKS